MINQPSPLHRWQKATEVAIQNAQLLTASRLGLQARNVPSTAGLIWLAYWAVRAASLLADVRALSQPRRRSMPLTPTANNPIIIKKNVSHLRTPRGDGEFTEGRAAPALSARGATRGHRTEEKQAVFLSHRPLRTLWCTWLRGT